MVENRALAKIEAAVLSRMPPADVYRFLEQRSRGEREPTDFFTERGVRVVDRILVRRGDPLIDLGVARFGRDVLMLKRLWRRGSDSVRLALLQNRKVGPKLSLIQECWMTKDELATVVINGRQSQVQALFTNKYIHDDLFKLLFDRSPPFDAISEERWANIIFMTAANERLAKPYDETFLDGWADFSYHEVFEKAWKLAETVPVTRLWAMVLSQLYFRVRPVNRTADFLNVVARWRTLDSDDKLYTAFMVRTRLCDLVPAKANLLSHEDPAVRSSFYRRFSFRKPDEMSPMFEREPKLFIEAALENMTIWRHEELRHELARLAWAAPDKNHTMDLPNLFNAQERHIREKHPEWFQTTQ